MRSTNSSVCAMAERADSIAFACVLNGDTALVQTLSQRLGASDNSKVLMISSSVIGFEQRLRESCHWQNRNKGATGQSKVSLRASSTPSYRTAALWNSVAKRVLFATQNFGTDLPVVQI